MKKTTKKIAGVMLALMAASAVCGTLVSCKKKSANKDLKIGVLSFLNLTEKEYADISMSRKKIEVELEKAGTVKMHLTQKFDEKVVPKYIFYDTLDSMIMALEAGEIKAISGLPSTTAAYLCSRNDKLETAMEFTRRPSEIVLEDSFSAHAISLLANGFSFMMLEKNKALHDEFDAALEEMQKDGTSGKLIQTHIVDVLKGKGVSPVIPEYKEGRKTIKVAVTGSLPPMDYVSPDGTFAGYNTAILAEIGKRLDKNITLVQVSSIGRATALASETVDVAFWTRGLSGKAVTGIRAKTPVEELHAHREGDTEAQWKVFDEYIEANKWENEYRKDMPENTILTIPYFSDYPIGIQLKK